MICYEARINKLRMIIDTRLNLVKSVSAQTGPDQFFAYSWHLNTWTEYKLNSYMISHVNQYSRPPFRLTRPTLTNFNAESMIYMTGGLNEQNTASDLCARYSVKRGSW